MKGKDAKMTTLGRFARTLLIVGAITGLLGYLAGCQERYTKEQCIQFCINEPNQAAGTAIVETARTEAATEAKIKIMAAAVELACITGAFLCVGGICLGVYLQSKLLKNLCIVGLITCIAGEGFMMARLKYQTVIAIAGLIVILGIFTYLIVLLIINRKALVQTVLSVEKAKTKSSWNSIEDPLKLVKENDKIQSITTEKIIDKIRNGGKKKNGEAK